MYTYMVAFTARNVETGESRILSSTTTTQALVDSRERVRELTAQIRIDLADPELEVALLNVQLLTGLLDTQTTGFAEVHASQLKTGFAAAVRDLVQLGWRETSETGREILRLGYLLPGVDIDDPAALRAAVEAVGPADVEAALAAPEAGLEVAVVKVERGCLVVRTEGDDWWVGPECCFGSAAHAGEASLRRLTSQHWDRQAGRPLWTHGGGISLDQAQWLPALPDGAAAEGLRWTLEYHRPGTAPDHPEGTDHD